MARILAFAGSARTGSLNKKLAALASTKARDLGAEVALVDLADYRMPLYDGDLEADEGIPESAAKVRDLLAGHDGFLISCPEYNGSITPLLKNVIDWATRPAEGVERMAAFTGKVAGLMSASPGALGGIRGLAQVRAILGGLGVLIVPGDVSVPRVGQAFAEDGSLVDEKLDGRLDRLVGSLLDVTNALRKV